MNEFLAVFDALAAKVDALLANPRATDRPLLEEIKSDIAARRAEVLRRRTQDAPHTQEDQTP